MTCYSIDLSLFTEGMPLYRPHPVFAELGDIERDLSLRAMHRTTRYLAEYETQGEHMLTRASCNKRQRRDYAWLLQCLH